MENFNIYCHTSGLLIAVFCPNIECFALFASREDGHFKLPGSLRSVAVIWRQLWRLIPYGRRHLGRQSCRAMRADDDDNSTLIVIVGFSVCASRIQPAHRTVTWSVYYNNKNAHLVSHGRRQLDVTVTTLARCDQCSYDYVALCYSPTWLYSYVKQNVNKSNPYVVLICHLSIYSH